MGTHFEELMAKQEAPGAAKRRHVDNSAARDLALGSESGPLTLEDAEKKRAEQAESQAAAFEAFNAELEIVTQIINETEASITRLESSIKKNQDKLAALDVSSPARKPYESVLALYQDELAGLRTKKLHGEDDLEGLKASQSALQEMLARMAPGDRPAN